MVNLWETLTRIVKVRLVSADDVTGILLLVDGVHYGYYLATA